MKSHAAERNAWSRLAALARRVGCSKNYRVGAYSRVSTSCVCLSARLRKDCIALYAIGPATLLSPAARVGELVCTVVMSTALAMTAYWLRRVPRVGQVWQAAAFIAMFGAGALNRRQSLRFLPNSHATS